MELFEGHDPSSFPYHGKILPGKLKELKEKASVGRGPPLVIIQNPKHIRCAAIMNTCDQQDLKDSSL